MTQPTREQLGILERDILKHEKARVPKMLADVETLRALLESWKVASEKAWKYDDLNK